jgi:hypothetical protein
MSPVGSGVRVDANELLLEDVFHNGNFVAIAGEGGSRVVEDGEEVDRKEATEIVLEREGGGTWDPENILRSFSFGGSKLGENWDEVFRNREGHEEFEEFVAPGRFFPETSIGGWGWTKVAVRCEEVTIEDGNVIHSDSGS